MTDSDGHSPLDIAIKHDKKEAEKYLRDHGSTAGDGHKEKLLLVACEQGRLDVVEEVVDVYNCDLTSESIYVNVIV